MHFERHGQTYQLRIRTAEQLEQVLELDDSLWIAMSAPVDGLNGDRKFLDLVDLDHNGRIRTDEMRTAIRWLLDRLADRGGIAEGSDVLPLAALEQSHDDARSMQETADYILNAIGAEDRSAISLAQVTDFGRHLDTSVINGDGIIPPEASEDPQVQQFIRDVIACRGGREDLTGRVGISEEDLEKFLKDAAAYLDWAAEGELPEGTSYSEVLPLGRETPRAWDALQSVRQKLDGFFARCRLIRFRPAAAAGAGIDGAQAAPADFADGDSIEALLKRAPLAEPNAEGILALDGDINPAYADALGRFRETVMAPILGETDRLTEERWGKIKARFAGYGRWLGQKPGQAVEKLGRAKLRDWLEGPCPAAVRRLLADDRLVADKLADVRKLEKLLLYQKHLLALANNFVSFPDLYDPERRAMFEVGSLVIDGRWFNLAIRVDDVKQHKEVAKTSRIFVLYAELTRGDSAQKLTVALPATAGTIGNLSIGKRGIFHSTDGRTWDARVVDIIENPISFREAMAAPFVRLGQFIGGKIEAISGTAQKALEAQVGQVTQKVQTGVQQTVQQAPQLVAQAGTQAAPAPASASARRDLLVGASFSIAALSSAFAFVTKQISALEKPLYTLGLALLVVLVVVSLPTGIVAAWKLARRDLSAILEGCGWAINARMRLNRRQRRQFTRQEPYPADATGTPRRRWLLLALVLILLGLLGWTVGDWIRQAPPSGQPAQTGAGAPPADASTAPAQDTEG